MITYMYKKSPNVANTKTQIPNNLQLLNVKTLKMCSLAFKPNFKTKQVQIHKTYQSSQS
ncbi:hypothetical protein HanXRQr2_Chr03g0127321 [Helianthus annuus]|uniref:Uncharacterized protein n=1 Tax=Helianthus annuus TaxID=4232 RepID=A0A9K3NY77_HELAN|nr:hypothetical protein HanXRQr2_Chr03g0127321 [Helianthus annuus]